MTREPSNAMGTPYCQIPRTISPLEQPDGGLRLRTDSDLHRAARPSGRTPRSDRGPAGLGAAIRQFWLGEHGGVAIESAVSLMILVVGFAGLMEIVQACYTDDRMSRAARAAARELALNPSADDATAKAVACTAIQRELRLAESFDCNAEWSTWKLHPGVSPSTLPATLDADPEQGTGDMVLVRIGDDSVTAIGLARCEIELCGQETS